MGKIKSFVQDVEQDINDGELTFQQIAVKYEISVRDVNQIYNDMVDEVQDLEYDAVSHDHLERDWDEPYEPEIVDCDSWYEEQYELSDY